MKKIINVLLTILLCLGCFTINVSALEETASEVQDVIDDEDVLDVDSENIAPDPIIEDAENEIVVADETIVEDDGADVVETTEPQEIAETQNYSLAVVYSFDDEYTTTLDSASYKPDDYGFLVRTTDGYITREVDEETKYYYIDSININSEPVAEDKIIINEDDNGNQEYFYLMTEEDTIITVLFSSKKDTESTEYTTNPACYQDEEGNIILRLDENQSIEQVNSIRFNAFDESNNRTYDQLFNKEDILSQDNSFIIPYSQIKYSNLKQGLEYQISLVNESVNGYLPIRFLLNKGSKRKDAPDYSVSQNDNGDIVFSFDDTEFLSNITGISFSGHQNKYHEYFGTDKLVCEGNTITIPYGVVKKSQLVEDEYSALIYHYANVLYFDNLPWKSITITSGSTLPSFPEYNIYQEDNGDIVITSENNELLNAVDYLTYIIEDHEYHLYNAILHLEENKLIFPYKNVVFSKLLTNKKYDFRAVLKSNNHFLYDVNNSCKEVEIIKGSVVEYLAARQEENGNIVIEMANNNLINSFKDYSFESILLCAGDEINNRNYSEFFDFSNLYISTNTITIVYSQIENSDLKQGLDYEINIGSSSSYGLLPDKLQMKKGSIKIDAPNYYVSQNADGDIVFSFDDADFVSDVTGLYFGNLQYGKYVNVDSDKLIYGNNTITLPYSVVQKSQLIEGKYDTHVYYKFNRYFQYHPYSTITINLVGSEFTSLPDFDIYQENNGDIVITSESSELLNDVGCIDIYKENGSTQINRESFIKKDNKVIVPYERFEWLNLNVNDYYVIELYLNGLTNYLYTPKELSRNILIKKGSISNYLSARQDKNGNVIIKMEYNDVFENFEQFSLMSVGFYGFDENNERKYRDSFSDNEYIVSGNTITIPYASIEYSNLKQDIEYQITLISKSNGTQLCPIFFLNKGSKRKDAPDYNVSQTENGDIVLHSDDSDFLDIITYLSIYDKNSVSFGKENFVYSSNDRTITIPYKVIEKSQLIEGKYNVDVYYEGMYNDNSPYFDNIPTKSVTITLGSILPTLPDFNIHQEDNGDIVLFSESEELIKQIDYISYWTSNNQRAGGPAFFEDSFIIDKNTITIPYSAVLLSQLESNTNYCFNIGLRSNDIFLYDYETTNREVYIEKGSIVKYLSAKQDNNGNIIIEMASNSLFDSIQDLSTDSIYLYGYDEINDRNYDEIIFARNLEISDNTITIPYNRIEHSDLKRGLEYRIRLTTKIADIYLSSRLLLNKGSSKKDTPDYRVNQNINGDIVFSFGDADFASSITKIQIYNFEINKYIYISNYDFTCTSGTITIPYSVIKESQLSKGEYNINLFYDYTHYFDDTSHNSLIITKGSILSLLPDFKIQQEDNGDIVLHSDSEELISQISRIYYWTNINQRAGSPSFDDKSFIVGKNTLTIPYQVVKYSELKDNNTYIFHIELKNDDIFLTGESSYKEVKIKLGSLTVDKPYLNISPDISGVASIKFDSQEDLNKLDKGEYQLNYLLYCGNEKETQIDRNSLIFDYDNKTVYAVMNLVSGEIYSINLVKGEEIVASGTYYVDSTPIIDQVALSQNIDEDKLLDYVNTYYDSLYPNVNYNISSIGIYTDVVQNTDIDKYFKIYSLSDSNSLILDISLYPTALYGNVEILKIPYDRPGENIKLELSASLEQMSKLGISKDNYTQNEIVVLREHDGKVDELVATLEPVVVGDTIISFKVKFETDKMSLFAIANKGSVIKPSTGSSGGSSTRKPVVNTSSK